MENKRQGNEENTISNYCSICYHYSVCKMEDLLLSINSDTNESNGCTRYEEASVREEAEYWEQEYRAVNELDPQ